MECALWGRFEEVSLRSVLKRALWRMFVGVSLGSVSKGRSVEKVWGSLSRKLSGERSV